MSDTPLKRLEQRARQLAIDTQLLVNKADAAAIVAAVMGKGCDEERFLEICKMAYQSATKRLRDSTAGYLDKMLPTGLSVPTQAAPGGETP